MSTSLQTCLNMSRGYKWHANPAPNNQNGYDSISNTTRKALVQLVTEQNLSVRKASKVLKIKYTTAKALVQKYRLTGNIDRQRARRMTLAEDERQVYRKDLMKELPIAVEEDSQDERWGFTPAATQDLNKPVSMKPNPNNRVYPIYSH